jgi:hypothetical protein
MFSIILDEDAVLDNLALSSVLSELSNVIVTVSSDYYCEFVLSYSGY